MKQAIKNLLVGAVRLAINLFGQGWRRRAGIVLREAMASNGHDEVVRTVDTTRGTLHFYCLGALSEWRAETLLTKEPETIAWIDAMDDSDVMFDIGANMGIYSLYAAINGKVRVCAFEPLAANYFLINRNIETNGLQDMVTAYCLALNDTDMIGKMHVQDTGFASSVSSFGTPVDHYGAEYSAAYLQGMVGMTLDNFIAKFDPPFPNHIKIDVDGIEDKIIQGAPATLADPRLKSLSIELDSARPEYTGAIISAIEAGGLRLTGKHHSEMFDDTPYADIYNYQFRR